jgi:hypothetical protein
MEPLKERDHDGLVTHSICDDCSDNLDFQLGVTLARYLDSLKVPIIAVNESGNIIAANGKARNMRHDIVISADWYDRIYECAHSRLPERCMKSVHCSGCTIRFITADVYRTGISQSDVPAHFNFCSADTVKDPDLLLSAEKVDGIVHLRIVKR